MTVHRVSDQLAVETDTISSGSAAALHGLLDSAGAPPTTGDPVPPLWHWLAFLPRNPEREMGTDGHPKVNPLFDSDQYPRRMFAGARISFVSSARIGEEMRRESRVLSIIEKSGRTGRLLFVTIEHRIESSRGLLLVEQQDIVYRSPSPLEYSSEIAGDIDSGDPWSWRANLSTDPVSLFRFSAVTYNAHRIHYDRPFATQIEGYPGLVVAGPYQAIGLAELCRSNAPQTEMESFSFRAQRPVFDGPPVKLRAKVDDGVVDLAAYDSSNHVTVSATAQFSGLATRPERDSIF
jgi:3-methylfumaryl-CoA hydratase